MISRDLKLTISNDKASLDEPVTIFLHDKNILLNITVVDYKFATINYSSGIAEEKIQQATTIIKSPDGKVYKYVDNNVENDIIKVFITNDLTDEIDEMGKYEMQIQICSTTNNGELSRVTLPPFFITLAKPITYFNEGSEGVTDEAILNTNYIGFEGNAIDNSDISIGYYDKNIWKKNQLITSAALNKIEKRIAEIYAGDGFRKTKIGTYKTTEQTTEGAINELKGLLDGLQKNIDESIASGPAKPTLPPVVEVTSIDIIDKSATLILNTNHKLNFNILPRDYSSAVYWESNDENVVTVNSNGVIFGVGPGTTAVTCYSYNGDNMISDSINVTVKEQAHVRSLTLLTDVTTMKTGEAKAIDCVPVPSNHSDALEWFAEPPGLVKISEEGVVKAYEPGEVTIKCRSLSNDVTSNGVVIEITGSPIVPLEGISITNVADLERIKLNYTKEIKYYFNPKDTTETDIEWIVEGENSASIQVEQIGDPALGMAQIKAVGPAENVTVTCRSLVDPNISASFTTSVIIPLERIEIRGPKTIPRGKTAQLECIYYPSNATYKDVEWSTESYSTNINVDQNGVITGIYGSDRIYCRSKMDPEIVYAFIDIQCVTLVDNVNIHMDSVKLNIGSSTTLTSTVSPGDATNKDLFWQSSNPEYAIVNSQTGEVTGISKGKSNITATALDGSGKSDTCEINVKIGIVDINLEVVPNDPIYFGQTREIRASLLPENTDDTVVTWSSNNGCVTFKRMGNIVDFIANKGVGPETIICTSAVNSSVRKPYYIDILPGTVTINEKLPKRVDKGDQYQLTATTWPFSDYEVVWSSSNEDAATVVNGLVTIVGDEGDFEIYCSLKHSLDTKAVSNTSTINVYPSSITVTNQDFNAVFFDDESQEFTVNYVVHPANCNTPITATCTINEEVYKPVKSEPGKLTYKFNAIGVYKVKIEGVNGISATRYITVKEADIAFINNGTPFLMINGNSASDDAKKIRINSDGTTLYGYITDSPIQQLSFRNTNGVNDRLKEVLKINITSLENTALMFANCTSLTYVNTGNWDNSIFFRADSMFIGCTSLIEIDLSEWDTSRITNMSRMFEGCELLEKLDTVNWDTSNVTDMHCMFKGCKSLREPNVSNWKTGNVVNMESMFEECMVLSKVDVSNWDTSSVLNMRNMFKHADINEHTLDVSGWDTGNVTDMSGLFYNTSLGTINVSTWDTSNVTDMSNMFNGSGLYLIDVSDWDTSNVTDMSGMFIGFRGEHLDLSSFKTGRVNSIAFMLRDCHQLINVNLSNWNTSNISNMAGVFQGCLSLETVNIDGWNTVNVNDMSSMFLDCGALKSLDLSEFRVEKVTSMRNMFAYCSSLENINLLNWRPIVIEDVTCMFEGCYSLNSLNLENWTLANIERKQLNTVLKNCTSLTTLNIKNLELDHVISGTGETVHIVDSTCKSLKYIICDYFRTFLGLPMRPVGNPGYGICDDYLFDASSRDQLFNEKNWYVYDDNVISASITSDIPGNDAVKKIKPGDSFNIAVNVETVIPVENPVEVIFDSFYLEKTGENQFTVKHVLNEGENISTTLYCKSTYTNESVGNPLNLILYRESEFYVEYIFEKGFSTPSDLDSRIDATDSTGLRVNMPYFINVNGESSYEYDKIEFELENGQTTSSNLIQLRNVKKAKLWYPKNAQSVIFKNLNRPFPVAEILHINTSNFTRMNSTFENCQFLQRIYMNKWDVTKVLSMSNIFNGCVRLDVLDIRGWGKSKFDNTSFKNGTVSVIKCNNASAINEMNYWLPDLSFMSVKGTIETTCKPSEIAFSDLGNGWYPKYINQGIIESINIQTNVSGMNIRPGDSFEISIDTYPVEYPNDQLIIEYDETVLSRDGNTFTVLDTEEVHSIIKYSSKFNLGAASTVEILIENPYYIEYTLKDAYIYDESYSQFDYCLPTINDVSSDRNASVIKRIEITLSDGNIKHGITDIAIDGTVVRHRFPNVTIADIEKVRIYHIKNVTSIHFGYDASSCVDSVCHLIKSLNYAKLDSINDISSMFYNCNYLESVTVNNWNTINVDDMSYMFNDCHMLSELDLSNWNIRSSANVTGIFNNCDKLNYITFDNLNTLTRLCSELPDRTNLTAGTVKLNFVGALPDNVNDILVSKNWNTSRDFISLENIKMKNDVSVINVYDDVFNVNAVLIPYNTIEREVNWICNPTNIANIEPDNLKCRVNRLDYGETTLTCISKTSPMISTSMKIIFLDIFDSFDMILEAENPIVLKINGENAENDLNLVKEKNVLNKLIFTYGYNVSDNINIKHIEFSTSYHLTKVTKMIDTSNLNDMSNMFAYCTSLSNLDVSNWNTSNVEDMNNMFIGCTLLSNLDVSNWNTSKVTSMSNMFAYCPSITSLNLASWNLTNVNNVEGIFRDCINLSNLKIAKASVMEKLYNELPQRDADNKGIIEASFEDRLSNEILEVLADKNWILDQPNVEPEPEPDPEPPVIEPDLVLDYTKSATEPEYDSTWVSRYFTGSFDVVAMDLRDGAFAYVLNKYYTMYNNRPSIHYKLTDIPTEFTVKVTYDVEGTNDAYGYVDIGCGTSDNVYTEKEIGNVKNAVYEAVMPAGTQYLNLSIYANEEDVNLYIKKIEIFYEE